MAHGPWRLGSDIGGTFTDFVLQDAATGRLHIEKCLTTPARPEAGVLHGVRALAGRVPGYVADTERMFHATTLVTNAVIERKGARTALITTRGFRDVLEIGVEERYDVYDMLAEYPAPLIPRDLRFEVAERLHASGQVLEALAPDALQALVAQVRAAGVESVAVVLLHAYANPVHERAIAAAFARAAPEVFVSISSEVLPEIKEYERTCTTAINAYARPLAHRYLTQLEGELATEGYRHPLLLMLSSGGITPAETARRYPVRILESGPAAGVIATEYFGRLAGLPNLFAFDMGGTTAKGCAIKDGSATKTHEFEAARLQRFKRGSGIPIKLPVVDMIEIGAGGGSIAHVGHLGTLQVGPESAASRPGPACYGLGGARPTVSDADLLLGYLDPDYFLGGAMRLDRAAAEAAVRHHIAGPLGLSVTEAAWGIHNIVNENMALASKIHLLERGENPAHFTVVAFGGAGPVHAWGLGRKLKVSRILVPPAAGVMSALGLLVAPLAFDVVHTCKARLASADFTQLEALCAAMRDQGAAQLAALRHGETIRYSLSADMRYIGQGYEVNVPLPEASFARLDRATIAAAFAMVYRKLYQRVYDLPLELVNLRLTATLDEHRAAALVLPGAAAADSTAAAPAEPVDLAGAVKGTRPVYFPEGGFRPATVYDRYRLAPGARLAGPAIIEERESTIVVGPDTVASVDVHGIVALDLNARQP